jgi:hypothetical protein
MLPIMSKLSGLAVRIALFGAMTGGVVAACYDQVPGPSGPLPPTKEAKPLGSKPKQIKPTVEMNQKFSSDQAEAEEPVVPSPTTEVLDAGTADVVDLPPVPDAGDVLPDAPE